MNPKLLKDLILAGHRVACKDNDGEWIVFLFIRGDGQIQGTDSSINIEGCIESGLSSIRWNDYDIKNSFTGEYKIVTPLPQLPQVGDTVEVLEICRELPGFDEWGDDMKNMVGNKYKVKEIDNRLIMRIGNNGSSWWFENRQVAKCEPENVQSIQSEEKLGDTIVVNGRTYQAI